MSIYLASITPFSRGAGDSMVPKAAYRAGDVLLDERSGRTADYRPKHSRVEKAFIIAPHGLRLDRGTAWNKIEHAEKRRDARVGRELLVALPAELSPEGRESCARRIAQYLVVENGTFVDCALHLPSKMGDQRNFHCHILFPTRAIDHAGNPTTKLRHWDDISDGPKTILAIRAKVAEIVNDELAKERLEVRVDHRSNRDRHIEARPGVKLGVAAIGIERRTGQRSSKRIFIEAPIEIDPDLVADVKSFLADQAKSRHGDKTDIKPAVKPDIRNQETDLSVILGRLRAGAEKKIKVAMSQKRTNNRRELPYRKQEAQRHKSSIRSISRPLRSIFPAVASSIFQIDRRALIQVPSTRSSALGKAEPEPQPTNQEKLDAYCLALEFLEHEKADRLWETADFIDRAIEELALEFAVPKAVIDVNLAHSRREITKGSLPLTSAFSRACRRLLEALAEKMLSTEDIRLRESADHTTDIRFSSDLRFLIEALKTGKYAERHPTKQITTFKPSQEPAAPKRPAPAHESFFVLLEEGEMKEGVALTQGVRRKQIGGARFSLRKPEAQVSKCDVAAKIAAASEPEVIKMVESDKVHDAATNERGSQKHLVKPKAGDHDGNQDPRVKPNVTASPNRPPSGKKGDGWER